MELYRRDLGSTELWLDSLERSRKRRRLAHDGRRRVSRQKGASTAVTAAMLFGPALSFAGAKTSQGSGVAQASPANRAIESDRTLDVVLKQGDTGTRVAQLQQLLAIDADGIFGERTDAAVRSFQSRAGLAVDGVVGQSTWGALLSGGGKARGAAADSVVDGKGYQVTVSRASEAEAEVLGDGAKRRGAVAKIVLTTGDGDKKRGTKRDNRGGPVSPETVDNVDTEAPAAEETPAGERVACGSGRLVMPVKGTKTSDFGPRGGRHHAGVDIAAPTGTPVRAAACGVISELGSQGGYGNIICIDHGSGFTTCYAHLSGFNTRKGAQVHAGDIIGYVGSTGNSTGPHLHFETRVNGSPRDPAPYLSGSQRAPGSHAKTTSGAHGGSTPEEERARASSSSDTQTGGTTYDSGGESVDQGSGEWSYSSSGEAKPAAQTQPRPVAEPAPAPAPAPAPVEQTAPAAAPAPAPVEQAAPAAAPAPAPVEQAAPAPAPAEAPAAAPVEEAPVAEAPAPVAEAPAPVAEAPAPEAPAAEAPAAEAPAPAETEAPAVTAAG